MRSFVLSAYDDGVNCFELERTVSCEVNIYLIAILFEHTRLGRGEGDSFKVHQRKCNPLFRGTEIKWIMFSTFLEYLRVLNVSCKKILKLQEVNFCNYKLEDIIITLKTIAKVVQILYAFT